MLATACKVDPRLTDGARHWVFPDEEPAPRQLRACLVTRLLCAVARGSPKRIWKLFLIFLFFLSLRPVKHTRTCVSDPDRKLREGSQLV